MIEWTRTEHEALEAKLTTARELFLAELAKNARLSRLYGELKELEMMGIEARRSRREREVLEGGLG